jgi:N-methylhydantoinase A/oxoprolinase/acetone carboxylase beta subunit
VSIELVTKILDDEATPADGDGEIAANILLRKALAGTDGSDLSCALTLHMPLVAIGAPVSAYMPDVAARLHTELVIPPFADVANAVGAVAGGVVQRLRVLINPIDEGALLRTHMADGVHDFESVDEAVAYAEEIAFPQVEEMARQAGAEQIEVRMERKDQRAPTSRGGGEDIYLGTELTFTAVGRPSMARK